MECTLYDTYDIPSPNSSQIVTTLILGLIKCIHVRKDVLTERGTINPAKMRAVSMIGTVKYVRVGDAFRLERPRWGEDREIIERGGG